MQTHDIKETQEKIIILCKKLLQIKPELIGWIEKNFPEYKNNE